MSYEGSSEAANLARALARQTGRTISDVVLDALRQYRRRRRSPAPEKRVEHWRKLLNEDRKRRAKTTETSVEALYDKTTRFPA